MPHKLVPSRVCGTSLCYCLLCFIRYSAPFVLTYKIFFFRTWPRMNFLELTSYGLYLSSKREKNICLRMFNHVVYKTFPRDFSRRSRSVVVKEMYQKAWRISVNSCCFSHITRRRGYLSPPPLTQYIHQQLSQY